MRLIDIITAMRAHDRVEAAGSESAQWGEFIKDAVRVFGELPYHEDQARDVVVDPDSDFARYWLAVADRDYTTATKYGDMPDEWTQDAG